MKVTAGELMDRGVWLEACDELGINEWTVNEGRMDRDDEVSLTLEQAAKIGFLRVGDAPARREP